MNSSNEFARSQPNRNLYSLALRLIAHHLPAPTVGSTFPIDAIEIFIQQLPDTFPKNIPFPEKSTLLGSLVNTHLRQMILEFDSGLSPQQVVEFYQFSMPIQGWYEHRIEHPFMKQLFVPADKSKTLSTIFCKGKSGPSLEIRAYFHSERSSQFSLVYEYGSNYFSNHGFRHSPCAVQTDKLKIPFNPSVLIPSLFPPPDTHEVDKTAIDKSHHYARQSITIETSLSLTAILDHYRAQFEQSRWICSDSGVSDPAAWSIWKLNHLEQNWRSIFYILRTRNEPLEYLITVHVSLD